MARVIEERDSKYSGRIQVIEDVNGVRLVAGELDQSGGAVKRVVTAAVEVTEKITNGLVLGLGGGTVVGIIQKRFPEARLTCVEIDPVMVELAGKYFDIAESDNLHVVCDDAERFVKNTEYRIPAKGAGRQNKGGEQLKPQPNPLLRGEGKGAYDYILVDCYLGGQVPEQCETKEFLRGVKDLLTSDGLVVFNRLFYDAETRRRAQEFIFKLEPVFGKIDLKRSGSNLLIVGQRM